MNKDLIERFSLRGSQNTTGIRDLGSRTAGKDQSSGRHSKSIRIILGFHKWQIK